MLNEMRLKIRQEIKTTYLYEGLVGEYLVVAGEYAGLLGEYSVGEVGLYCR